jgi:polar amino acid transport system substrate-binding protein
MKNNRILLLLFALLTLLVGCNRIKPETLLSSLTGPAKLKVGIAYDEPPLAYRKNDTLTGLETKFAAGLANATGKTLELIELPRQGLPQALLDKKIDIIMSGLTAATAQEQKLAITTPYLISGQVALVHLDVYKQLGNNTRNLTEPKVRIGVVTESPGDALIKGLKPQGKIIRYASAPEGVKALIDNAIDVFVHNLPANFYYASLYVDKGLTPGATLMTHEQLVWGVRPNDPKMLKAADEYLAAIQQSGELQNLIERAIPFYKNTAYSPRK